MVLYIINIRISFTSRHVPSNSSGEYVCCDDRSASPTGRSAAAAPIALDQPPNDTLLIHTLVEKNLFLLLGVRFRADSSKWHVNTNGELQKRVAAQRNMLLKENLDPKYLQSSLDEFIKFGCHQLIRFLNNHLFRQVNYYERKNIQPFSLEQVRKAGQRRISDLLRPI